MMFKRRMLCTILLWPFAAVTTATKPFEGTWDVVKIASDGVRDPDPKYHPDIPRPEYTPGPYEDMVRQDLDFHANEYIKNARMPFYTTCLAKLCGRIVPAVCPKVEAEWPKPVWFLRQAKQSSCGDFKLLDEPYSGTDTEFKHKCVK
jgi:hypothetical protein